MYNKCGNAELVLPRVVRAGWGRGAVNKCHSDELGRDGGIASWERDGNEFRSHGRVFPRELYAAHTGPSTASIVTTVC